MASLPRREASYGMNKISQKKQQNAHTHTHTHLPDAPNFWLANQIFLNNLCVYAFMYYHISCLIYSHILFHFLSLHKSLVYPPFVYILYDECCEEMTGEYSSEKY